jgi:hypothetical protein
VIGLREGYRWLVEGDASHTVELHIAEVSRIHFTGGSILLTSRTTPARDEQSLQRVIHAVDTGSGTTPTRMASVCLAAFIENLVPPIQVSCARN